MRITILSAFLSVLALLSACNNIEVNGNDEREILSKVEVENIQIKKEYSNAWAVTGLVRNISSTDIKGAVKVKFLNSNGDVVHNNAAFVNDGDPIRPGQAGNFEYYADPDKFDDVTNFDVLFYER